MIEDALISEYFNLSDKRKEELLNVIYSKLEEAFFILKDEWGTEHAINVLDYTLNKEEESAIEKENYEYAELIKLLKEYIDNALT